MRDEFAKIRSKLRSEVSFLFFSFSTKLRGHLFVFMSVVANFGFIISRFREISKKETFR